MSLENDKNVSSGRPSAKQAKPSVKTAKPSASRVTEASSKDASKREREVKEVIETSTPEGSKKPRRVKKEKPRKEGKKSRKILIILLVVFVILAVAGVALFIMKKRADEKKAYEASLIVYPEQTSGYAIDRYSSCLSSFNIASLGDGSVVEESALVDEVKIFNSSEEVESFTKWVCSKSKLSGGRTDVRVESVEADVSATLTTVDWVKISETLDSEKIQSLMKEMGISASDLDLGLKLPNLFIKYVMSLEEVPTITSTVPLIIERVNKETENSTYYYIIKNDSAIDDALFSSESFHSLLESFSKQVVGWTGYKMEKYIVQEEQENPAYVAWLEQLNVEMAKFPKWENSTRCLYEPFYLRDANNKIVKDESGNKVVNFYVLFEAGSNGKKVSDSTSPYKYKYIPEPEHTIMVDVEKERQVEDPWVENIIFPYNWIGYSYAVTNGLPIRSGHGTQESPLDKNTWVLTKVNTLYGSQVDAKIEMVSWYRGSEAIQFALDKSEKNRGLDSGSIVELVVCEFKITNMSEEPIVFVPDMVLVDEFGSKLSRTGTIYGLTEEVTLGSGESVVIQDWATSTDMSRYQVAWGKSFDVNTPMVYFNVIDNEK